MFFDGVIMGPRPTYEDENGFYSATSLPGSAALPFVISTGAQRSGEISVLMPLPGNVFDSAQSASAAMEDASLDTCSRDSGSMPRVRTASNA